MQSNDSILIGKLRDKFRTECCHNPELYDSSDLVKLTNNDWTYQRFLLAANLNVENALVMITEAMRWRKAFGVNLRSDLDYPHEFYRIGAFFSYCVDRDEKVVIYLRVKLYKHFPKFFEYFKQFLIHIINKIDTQSGEKGWAMVWDLTGAGPSNWDLSMIRFVITSLSQYFPKGMQYLVIYGMPWVMTAFVNIGLKILPEEYRNRVKFANKNQIFEYIAPDNFPEFMAGKCPHCHRKPPKGVKGINELGIERGYSVEEINSVLKYYEKYLTD